MTECKDCGNRHVCHVEEGVRRIAHFGGGHRVTVISDAQALKEVVEATGKLLEITTSYEDGTYVVTVRTSDSAWVDYILS